MKPSRRSLLLLSLSALLSSLGMAQRATVKNNGFQIPPRAKAHSARPHGQPPAFSVGNAGSLSPDTGYYSGYSGLIQAWDGFYYATTQTGAANNAGSVIKAGGEGEITAIYSFCAVTSCADGSAPTSGIIQGVDGYLYGTTSNGGANQAGTIFRLSLGGAETVLYSFCSAGSDACIDGSHPHAPLVQAVDGKLYGTAFIGGTASDGVLFSIDPAGNSTNNYNYTVLHTFDSGSGDGVEPIGSLVQAADGNLYGVTLSGGANNRGTIFDYSLSGNSFATVYNFCSQDGCTDGYEPTGGLVQTADGSLWGTTTNGGSNSAGTIYSWDGSALTTENNFESSDGDFPESQLFLGSDGNFYGGTDDDGAYGYASLFQLVPGTSPTTNYIYQFGQGDNTSIGAYVSGGLLQAFDGSFYGLAASGGNGYGTVFNLVPPAPLAGPVKIDFYPAPDYLPTPEAPLELGQSIALGWSASNAFSTSMQQCFASVLGDVSNAGAWSGLQSGTLANGLYNQSTSITPTAVGGYIYVLTCGGVESGAGFLQVMETPTITPSATPSTTIITGGALTLSASVAGTGSTVPTGTMDFVVNGTTLGSTALVGGSASLALTTTGLPAATYTVTFNYSGDSNYNSTSTTTQVTVLKADTTTMLAVSSHAVSEGQPVTVTVTVTGADGTVPAGKVNLFADGVYYVGSAKLNRHGVATLTYNTPISIVGSYTGHAVYAGSAVHNSSTSGTQGVTISKAPTSVSVEANPNPVTSPASVTFTVTVTRTATGATGNAGGYVNLMHDGKVLGHQALDGSGVATFTLPTTDAPAGNYTVGAIYYGDKGDQGATAIPISVMIN